MQEIAQAGMEVLRDLASRQFSVRPDRLFLVITRRCNARCRMCNIWADAGVHDLTAAEWAEIIRANRDFLSAIVKLDITGGEPFLRSDLNEIVGVAVAELSSLRKIIVTSNGFLTQRLVETTRELLAVTAGRETGVYVTVSIDGLGETHDSIRGTEGAYARATETLGRLCEMRKGAPRLHISVATVIHPENVAQLGEIFGDIRSRFGVEDHLFLPAVYSENFQRNINADIGLTAEHKRVVEAFLEARIGDKSTSVYHKAVYRDIIGFLNEIEQKRLCPLLRRSLVIDNDGKVMPCFAAGQEVYGRASDGLARLWKSEARRCCMHKFEKNRCPHCGFICGVGYWAIIRSTLRSWLRGS